MPQSANHMMMDSSSFFPSGPMSDSDTRKPGWRAILLGLFVLFQAIYLPLANLIQLVPRAMPEQNGELDIRVQARGRRRAFDRLQEAINVLGEAIDGYGELSGQVQAWSLFAPDFGKQSVFTTCEFQWVKGQEVGRVTLRSAHMPGDPENHFRWPSSDSRLRAYEFLLAGNYWHFSHESFAAHEAEWRQAISDQVRRQQRTLGAYFRHELERYQKEFPELPSANRHCACAWTIFPSPKPGEAGRSTSFSMPLARWRPDQKAGHGCYAG